MTMKERFLPEDHAGQHATQAPHVQAVVIHLQISKNKKLELVSWLLFIKITANPRSSNNANLQFLLTSPGSLPAVQVLWSTWMPLSHCILGLGGKTPPNPSQLDGAENTSSVCLSNCNNLAQWVSKRRHDVNVNQLVRQYLSVFMINHDIVWLDISVHYPHTVAVIQSLLSKKGNNLLKLDKL